MPARAAAVCLLCLLAMTGLAHAGPWEATLPDGRVLRIVQDSTRTRDGYLLERRYPGGEVDVQFGNAGTQVFSLGSDNEGPAALRSDSSGRAWVAGASVGAAGARAVVLRFGPQGQIDSGFAQQGRSAMAPAGQQARALDLAPMDDGSAWVVGLLIDSQGAERSGAWRVQNDGSVDTRFGLGGLWRDAEAGATEPAGVALAPDGSVAVGLRRSRGDRAWLEAWAWPAAGGAPQLLSRSEVAPTALAAAQLSWQAGSWQWRDGQGRTLAAAAPASGAPPQVLAPTAAASTAGPPPAIGQTTAQPAAQPTATPPRSPRWPAQRWALAAAGVAALAAAAAWALKHWQRRRRP